MVPTEGMLPLRLRKLQMNAVIQLMSQNRWVQRPADQGDR